MLRRRGSFLLSALKPQRLHERSGKILSRLPNGMRVLTVDDNSGATGLAFLTLAGPRWETDADFGCSNVMEALPLKSNALIEQPRLSRAIGAMGNSIKMQNHKECLSYLLMAPRYHVREALQVLNAVTLHPTKDEKVFAEALEQTQLLSQMFARDATRCCFEYIHQAAWSGKGLGQPLIQTPSVLEKLTLEKLHKYHRKFVRPERSVIVATGVRDHDQLLQLVQEEMLFDCDSDNLETSSHPYTGGGLLVQNLSAPETVRKFEELNHSHIGLCFKGVPMTHPDYYAYAVIQTLLGGGTSFSSGGPGKGMQTKLFREVINMQGWIHGVECVTAWYRDNGLVGLYGQVEHQWVTNMLDIMIDQLASIPDRVTEFHWDMAKNQLLAQLVLLTENREFALEEHGKNLLLGDHVQHSEDLIAGTAKVTLADLRRVCDTMAKDPIVYAVYGNTEPMPDYDEVSKRVKERCAKYAASRK